MLIQNSSATNEWQHQQLCDIIDKVIRKLPEIGSAFIVNSRQNTSTHVCSLDIEIQTQAKLQNIRSQNLWKNKGGPSSIISKCTRKFSWENHSEAEEFEKLLGCSDFIKHLSLTGFNRTITMCLN